nr:probable ATP-dependent helicase PF08_0048 [Dermatophagoides farinae]
MDSNCKRKIDFISLTSSTIEKKIKNDVKECFENYRLFPDETGDEQLTKAQDSIRQYMKMFGEIVTDPDLYEASLTKLTSIIDKLKANCRDFIKNPQFIRLFDSFTDDLSKNANSSIVNIAITLHNDLMKELYRFTLPTKSEHSKVGLDRKTQRKINKLTLHLKKIQDKLFECQLRPLTLDEMEDETVFTKYIPRLEKQAVQIWQRRETLLNRSTDSGSQLYRKFTYNQLDDPQLNQIVEDYFNQYLFSLSKAENETLQSKKLTVIKLPMFTIFDLKEAISDQLNAKKIDFQLTDDVLIRIYRHIIDEMDKRRSAIQCECLDNYHILNYTDSPDSTVAIENDAGLIEQLERNSVEAKDRMETLITEYKKKDLEINGHPTNDDSKSLGWDDDNNDDDSDEDDNDIDDDDNGGDDDDDDDVGSDDDNDDNNN